MRVYLDEDVDPRVKKLLEQNDHKVDRAQDLGIRGIKDEHAYEKAVRQGYDLVITCNAGRTPEAREGNFVRNVEDHLRVRRQDFPIPVHELWEPGIGNNWNLLQHRWAKHERQIEHHARQIEHTNPEKRHAEAEAKLENQLARAERLRATEQEQEKATQPERAREEQGRGFGLKPFQERLKDHWNKPEPARRDRDRDREHERD